MKLRRLSAFFLCLLLLGCGSTATEESENGGDNPAKDDKMTVHVKSWDETQTLVAGKKGKVVVIDLWHLWWAHCVEEDLPQLVQLQKKHGDAVAAMTFNVNYSGEEEDKEEIIAKLKEIGVGPAIENILSTEPADDVYAKLDLGAVPAVYVFDKSGQLAERFDYNDPEKFGEDGFSYEKHVGPLVDKLVNQ